MLALVAISGLLSFFTLAHGHNWGDDFSVYISQGIALDQGRFEQQTVANGQIISAEGPVTYVWGYPLLLSLVHRMAGFDFDAFTSLIYYKVPAALCLALWGIVLYLYYRKRFSRGSAFAGSLIFCANPVLLAMCNEILTDIPFALFSGLALLLMDSFLVENGERSARGWVIAIALGVSIYIAYIVRYAGMVLIAVLFVSQVFYGWRTKGKPTLRYTTNHEQRWKRAYSALFQCLPYITFILIYVIIGFFIPYAKTQASDALTITPRGIASNILYYILLIKGFIMTMIPFAHGGNLIIVLVLAVTGLGILKCLTSEMPATLFLIGTMMFVVLLPYQQGLRYILNVLPLIILFFARGIQHIFQWLGNRYSKSWGRYVWKYVGTAIFGVVCLTILIGSARQAQMNMSANRRASDGAYSEDAVSMYRYIREKLPAHQRVAFSKGRALSLNTDRVNYYLHPSTLHALSEADFLLTSEDPAAVLLFDEKEAMKQMGIGATVEYEKGTMTLYKLERNYFHD